MRKNLTLPEKAELLLEDHYHAMDYQERMVCRAIIWFGDQVDYLANPQQIQLIEQLAEEHL